MFVIFSFNVVAVVVVDGRGDELVYIEGWWELDLRMLGDEEIGATFRGWDAIESEVGVSCKGQRAAFGDRPHLLLFF